MKTTALSMLLILMSSFAIAQPVPLTATNSNPLIGELYYKYCCHATGVPAGASGAAITWNYSSLTDSTIDTVSVDACSSTAYCDSFPGSSFMIAAEPDSNYDSYIANVTELKITGSLNIYSPWYTYSFYQTPLTLLKYPLAYGDTWRDTSLFSQNSLHIFSPKKNVADGYGTLITPGGTYTNVLRLHWTSTIVDTDGAGSSSVFGYAREETYFWYQPGIHHPILIINFYIDSTHGTGELFETVFLYSDALIPGFLPVWGTGVSSVNATNESISVFPNPVKDLLHIKCRNANIHNTDVALFDITGRKVAVSIDENSGKKQDEISISVSSLPSGLYLLKIKTSSGIITKKVEITK